MLVKYDRGACIQEEPVFNDFLRNFFLVTPLHFETSWKIMLYHPGKKK